MAQETTAQEALAFAQLSGLLLTPELLTAFAADGITAPTAVQLAAFEPILSGRNVVVHSGTGTGKTLAYLLPVLQRLRADPAARAVCFAPSVELAFQTTRVAQRYAPDLQIACTADGGNRRKERARVQKSTQLVVGTPGRLLSLFEDRKLKGISCMILDEVEPILASTDVDYLREIASRPTPRVQLIFAAATFGVRSETWFDDLGPEALVRLEVDDDPLRSRIAHLSTLVPHEGERDEVLARVLKRIDGQQAIVFINQAHHVRHLYRFLGERGFRPLTLNAERSKQQRQRAVEDFKKGLGQVLLTTDAGATGLDVPGVSWVVNYEAPHSSLGYVHRAGRTARAGRSGSSVVLVAEKEQAALRRMARELKLEFGPYL